MKFINRSKEDLKQENKYGKIPEYTEMDKLIPMLCKADIPCDLAIHCGRPQIFYPSYDDCICDVICHWGSCGHEDGLLEIMGLADASCEDDVEGYLTAEEVFEKISKHYDEEK